MIPQETKQAIAAKAPTSSYKDLKEEFGLTYWQIAAVLHKAGVRIGHRSNLRCNTKHPARQLEIVAAMKNDPTLTHAEVGRRFGVTRELVGQIACDARRLGLI